MNLFEHVIQMDGRADVAYLIPLGDIHYGSKNCDVDKLKETIEWIRKTKHAYTILMGDMCEYIVSHDHKRWDADNISEALLSNISNLPIKQSTDMIKMLTPIKDRIIGIIRGNHEEAIRLHHSVDVTNYMACGLGIKDLGSVTMGRLSFRRQKTDSRPNGMGRTVDVFACHGYGAGRLIGSKINNLQNLSKYFDADIYLMGHVHSKVPGNEEYLKLNHSGEPRLVAHKRIFALTGTFFKTFQVGSCSYSEKAMYPPTVTGVVKIRIEPFNHTTGKDRKSIDLPVHIHVSA